MRWADDMASRRDLDRDWVRQAIGQAHFLPGVPRLMLPPPTGTAKNWRVYRSRFIDPIRIRAGVAFWQANRATLERAAKEYLVPVEIIVGIIGVETVYGQQMGSYRVIDALATLAFDFPASHPRAAARQEFFRGELEQFLSLSQRTGADPMTPWAATQAPWGCPSSCRPAWSGTRWTSTATAGSTSAAAQPTSSARWPAISRRSTGSPACPRTTLCASTRSASTRMPCWPRTSCLPSASRPSPPKGLCSTAWPSTTRGRSRWWNCRMAMRRPATWQARRTSMRSPATTGAATTPWR
jgi:hypothetical protein